MAAPRSWIAGVGCAGIIVVAVQSDMATACGRITVVCGAGISVITIIALGIGPAIHHIGLIYDLKVKENGLSIGILLRCRRWGINASRWATGVNSIAVAIIAAY
jgi:hypothetical protein